MKKRIYRIEQTKYNGVVNEVSLMACVSNGSGKYIPLQYMADYVEKERLKYPVLTYGIQVTISGNTLLIDKGTENLLAITEVEIFDLSDESPTVFTYLKTGIADDNMKECIN